MLDQSIRTAILKLHERGLSERQIARALKVSRGAAAGVIESGTAEVPRIDRAEKAEPYRERILELLADCKGNLVRVHEKLAEEDGCEISYQALTSFCRRHQIGKKPKPRAGHYHFEPGQEMQHDTSPHKVEIGGKTRLAQCASLVLCYSRMKYFQYYPNFTRFECKLFLAEAVQYFKGSCLKCMIDNTHVVVLKGTGANMVPVPEMAAYSEQFGYEFEAHEKGDANRSARVERPFHHIENNFLAGRKASDWRDLNRQAVAWCDKDNAKFKRHLRASHRELFALERVHLVALPDWVAEVYQLHQRMVGVDGYVTVHTNLYSVPLTVPVGRGVEVRETRDKIDIYLGPRLVASHERVWDRIGKRVTHPDHRPRRKRRQPEVPQEERTILDLAPELSDYVAQLKKRGRGSTTLALRRLLSLVRDYPRAPLVSALADAEHYGLFDLQRVERMVLKRIAGDFFLLPDDALGDPDVDA